MKFNNLKQGLLILCLFVAGIVSVQASPSYSWPSFKVPKLDDFRLGMEYGSETPDLLYRILGGEGNFAYVKNEKTIGILSSDLQEIHSFNFVLPENSDLQTLIDFTVDMRYNGAVLVTQHVFNDDDLYEYIIITNNKDDGEYTYFVYNENGERLMEIPNIWYFMRNGDFYLVDREFAYDGSNYVVYYISEINQSDISYLSADNLNLTVIPNPVRADETLSINIPDNIEAGSVVNVLSIDGKILYSKKLVDKVAQIIIPGYMLVEGVNPVVITTVDGDVIATGKILKR